MICDICLRKFSNDVNFLNINMVDNELSDNLGVYEVCPACVHSLNKIGIVHEDKIYRGLLYFTINGVLWNISTRKVFFSLTSGYDAWRLDVLSQILAIKNKKESFIAFRIFLTDDWNQDRKSFPIRTSGTHRNDSVNVLLVDYKSIFDVMWSDRESTLITIYNQIWLSIGTRRFYAGDSVLNRFSFLTGIDKSIMVSAISSIRWDRHELLYEGEIQTPNILNNPDIVEFSKKFLEIKDKSEVYDGIRGGSGIGPVEINYQFIMPYYTYAPGWNRIRFLDEQT